MAIALGPPELLILLVIVLVLFGGAKLPKLARSLGQAQREFREGVSDAENENAAAAAPGETAAGGESAGSNSTGPNSAGTGSAGDKPTGNG